MAPHVHRWSAADPRCIVLIAHGHGEHAGRYEHVEQRLVEDGEAITDDLIAFLRDALS